MSKVLQILEQRCNFKKNAISENRSENMDLQRTGLPDDFLDFYNETDGGCGSVFLEQFGVTVEIILYSWEKMQEAKKWFCQFSAMLYEEAYLLDERSINAEERSLLNEVCTDLMILGEVHQESDDYYMLLYKDAFLLIDKYSLDFPFHVNDWWSPERELCVTRCSFKDFLTDILISVDSTYIQRYSDDSGPCGDGESLLWYRMDRTLYILGDSVLCSPATIDWCEPTADFFNQIDRIVIGEGCHMIELFYASNFFCNLKELQIPGTLTEVGCLDEDIEQLEFRYYFAVDYCDLLDIFGGCEHLESFVVSKAISENAVYASKDSVLFDSEYKTLLSCPFKKKGIYVIPSTVTTIEDAAFSDCEELTSVIIPNTVVAIGKEAFRNVRHISYHGSAQSANNWGTLSRN